MTKGSGDASAGTVILKPLATGEDPTVQASPYHDDVDQICIGAGEVSVDVITEVHVGDEKKKEVGVLLMSGKAIVGREVLKLAMSVIAMSVNDRR